MITVDNTSYSILKYIYKNPYSNLAKIKAHFPKVKNIEEILNNLENQKLISFRVSNTNENDLGYEHPYVQIDSYLITLLLGNIVVEQRHESSRQWKITTVIAVVATIGAYREELGWLLREIMKLLK